MCDDFFCCVYFLLFDIWFFLQCSLVSRCSSNVSLFHVAAMYGRTVYALQRIPFDHIFYYFMQKPRLCVHYTLYMFNVCAKHCSNGQLNAGPKKQTVAMECLFVYDSKLCERCRQKRDTRTRLLLFSFSIFGRYWCCRVFIGAIWVETERHMVNNSVHRKYFAAIVG